jgi:hypothetical protein
MDLKDELLNNSPDGDRQEEQAVIICLQFPIGKLQGKKALAAVFDLDDILTVIIPVWTRKKTVSCIIFTVPMQIEYIK